MDNTDFWRLGEREDGPRSPPAGFAGSGPSSTGGVDPDPQFELRGMDVGQEVGRDRGGKARQDQTRPQPRYPRTPLRSPLRETHAAGGGGTDLKPSTRTYKPAGGTQRAGGGVQGRGCRPRSLTQKKIFLNLKKTTTQTKKNHPWRGRVALADGSSLTTWM